MLFVGTAQQMRVSGNNENVCLSKNANIIVKQKKDYVDLFKVKDTVV